MHSTETLEKNSFILFIHLYLQDQLCGVKSTYSFSSLNYPESWAVVSNKKKKVRKLLKQLQSLNIKCFFNKLLKMFLHIEISNYKKCTNSSNRLKNMKIRQPLNPSSSSSSDSRFTRMNHALYICIKCGLEWESLRLSLPGSPILITSSSHPISITISQSLYHPIDRNSRIEIN
jgi:hypothetical protein